MTLPLALYGAATRLLEPLAPPVLAARARDGKEDRSRIGERLGRASRPRPAGPLVWLHGVSVGESVSLLPLVDALRARRPDLAILVTSGTVTAAGILAKRLPPGVIHQFAPIDAPGAVAHFLDHWRPGLAVLVESELWPNLIRGARKRGVRLALLSARMTEDSAQGWARVPASARALLGAFDAILAQDEATADRLTRLGGAVAGRLNLKRLGAPLPADERELARLRKTFAGRKVVLAASTHPGEEALIAGALRGLDALLVIVPRHPDRGPAIAAELGAPRRSADQLPAPETGVFVADTLGELGLFFRLAHLVVMGGAFASGVGGHNPLEAARLGRPVITGAEAFNATELYDELIARGGAIEVLDEDELSREVRRLLADPAALERMGQAALAYAKDQDAALDAAFAALQPLLPA